MDKIIMILTLRSALGASRRVSREKVQPSPALSILILRDASLLRMR